MFGFNVSLRKGDDDSTGVSLVYLGEATVVEYNYEGKPTAHYFKDKKESIEFILKQAYGLLSLGYGVVTND